MPKGLRCLVSSYYFQILVVYMWVMWHPWLGLCCLGAPEREMVQLGLSSAGLRDCGTVPDFRAEKKNTRASLEEEDMLSPGWSYDLRMTTRLVPLQIHGAASGEANGSRSSCHGIRGETAAGTSISTQSAFSSSDGTSTCSCCCFKAEEGEDFF